MPITVPRNPRFGLPSTGWRAECLSVSGLLRRMAGPSGRGRSGPQQRPALTFALPGTSLAASVALASGSSLTPRGLSSQTSRAGTTSSTTGTSPHPQETRGCSRHRFARQVSTTTHIGSYPIDVFNRTSRPAGIASSESARPVVGPHATSPLPPPRPPSGRSLAPLSAPSNGSPLDDATPNPGVQWTRCARH